MPNNKQIFTFFSIVFSKKNDRLLQIRRCLRQNNNTINSINYHATVNINRHIQNIYKIYTEKRKFFHNNGNLIYVNST